MDNDSKTTTDCKGEPEKQRQNRRQFFNGLGKWSLAIIAAVAALREGVDDVYDGIGSRFGTDSERAGDPLQQIARHGNLRHGNSNHTDAHQDHSNHLNGPFRDPGWRNSPG
jgi:hypothetical protein